MMVRTRTTLLLLVVATWGSTSPAAAPPPKPRFPPLSNGEAWSRLPRADPPLPSWARAMAASLPRTTTAMIGLDHLHRAANPLGPAMAARLRWAAADAIGCAYSRRYAEADLRRAGASADGLAQLTDDPRSLPRADRAVVLFARKLTLAGHEVTDEEVAELLDLYGAEKVVAMVHTIAFANFQNRIILALDAQVEPGGPLPPLDLHLDPGKRPSVPSRPPWKEVVKGKPMTPVDTQLGWGDRPFADIEAALERQKKRKSRVPLPGPTRLAAIPPEGRGQASRIVWTNVSMGYQPRLTKAWFDCMGLFPQEAQLDRVFGGTLFWVVTRSNECFY